MGKSADLKVNVIADAKQATETMSNLSREMEGFSKIKGTGMATSLLVWTGVAEKAFGMAKKLYGAGKELVDLYATQEQAETKLIATLKATGNQMGLTASEMFAMASSLQDVTTFGDEAIIELQKLFIASGKLTKEQLPKVIELSLDMATAMGGNATESAKALNKALAEPAKGIELLRDKNIFFTQSEADKIKELTASNRLMDAQAIILEKVANTYGGIAREVASTDTGKIQQIKNLMGDIKEGLGQGIVNALGPSFQWIIDRMEDIRTKINDLNASREIMNDLRGGVNVGEKYSPEAIQEQLAKLVQDNQYNEDLLRRTFVSQENAKKGLWAKDKLTMDDSGAFIQQPASYWSFDPMIQGIYNDYKKSQEEIRRLGQAVVVASNKPKTPIPTLEPMATDGDGSDPVTTQVEKALTVYEKIFQATTATEATQRRILELRIKDNQALLDHLDLQVSAGKMTEEEQALAEQMLKQQLDLDRTALGNLGKTPEIPRQTAGDFIESNRGLSLSAQVEAIDNNLKLAESFKESVEAGSEQEKQLDEIISSLLKQKEAVQAVGTETMSAFDAVYTVFSGILDGYLDLSNSITALQSQIYQNQIDALQRTLDAQKEAWSNYYGDLKEKHQRERDSLDAQYHWGLISAEEYFASLEDLQDKKTQAEEEATDKEEELQKKIDNLKEKQFENEKANSITQAIMAGAVGIANIWKEWAGNPIMAGILTGLTTASVASQVATIASQKYTPLAVGGVTTGPTHALIGEGGEPEMVLPLSKAQDMGFGGEGVINFTFNIGAGSDLTREEMVRSIFEAIEKAQRTGFLPRWRMTA